jgi:hypothetical protein
MHYFFMTLVSLVTHLWLASCSCNSDIVAGSLQVKVNGQQKDIYVIDPSKGYAGTVKIQGDKLTLGHGPRIYLGNA